MSEVFPEYRAVRSDTPLQQGDILEAVDPDVGMWARHLVVITADCDFAHAKHRGRVTCVPLLSKDEYLLEFRIPALREKYAAKRINELRALLPSFSGPDISRERLRAWPGEQEVDDVVASLQPPEDLTAAVKFAFQAISLIDANSHTVEESVTNLVESRMQQAQPPKRDKTLKEVLDFIRAPFENPPGDAMFISAIARGYEEGYFAYLRHVEQPTEPQIALTATRREHTYQRISHLRDRYAHALVLQFATVFMSIGLPGAYEDARDLHAMTLEERFT